MSPIYVATALREAWAEHEQKNSALRGMLHTPIYLAMTIATQIDDTGHKVRKKNKTQIDGSLPICVIDLCRNGHCEITRRV